jgi:hypothetical protein
LSIVTIEENIMLKIGQVVSNIDEFISNNGNLNYEFVIYEWVSDDNYRNRIVMEVWEVKAGDYPVDQNLEGQPTLLSDGVCHTFQWRLEELFDDREAEDDWELIDMEEASDPIDLIDNFPDEYIEDVSDVISSWFANTYATMNAEVQ